MRRRSHNHLILLSVLFWVVLLGGAFTYVTQGGMATEDLGEQTSEIVGKQYLETAFPVISRGVVNRDEISGQEVPAGDGAEDEAKDAGEKEEIAAYLKGMLDGSLPFLSADAASEEDGQGGQEGAASPDGSGGDGDGQESGGSGLTAGTGQEATPGAVSAEAKPPAEVPVLDTQESKKPLVLIYHTHATESYQPVNVGNFHSIPEEGTVRQVGNELTKALEAKGIPVIHDKTLHDNPSYNQSYGRSLATVQNYLKKNPSIKIVIDLHRDAASYTGNVGKTATINGNKVATYSLVIGKGNANVDKLHQFANRINSEADRLYPGLSGRIIDKEYRFNQYVSDQHLLLEVGNNENTIDQVKLTGKYFADVLEAYIKKYPQNE